ncbi:Glycosyl hydrolase family 48 [Ruminococcus sp. YE71]|uniref:glycoside hydrolase family 48 protein n=1 Tax=unclassified Ruminococcus TaxID=2608920 RepID=UPI00087F0E84|nr:MULTISPECIES: glycoside hydrolase family 48 protein [unclassified Ruminococcus]SDA09288.1 Glycosyl hydrolase family 48 [Ruminococcus sp. YE78]SFW12731.1 Glycosyl hydrolase family 48 [Ruminococcus sp. YE71]
MVSKKIKAAVASVLTAAMAANVVSAAIPASAATSQRTKANQYGEDTYAQRFMSLYYDVVTQGQQNGYMSSNNGGANSFGIPYHSKEEVIIEAPDYGHETTSEAMSYLVWVAAMHDNIVKNSGQTFSGQSVGDLAKAWKTMEVMIPDTQDSFWAASSVSAQYCGEYDTPDQCPNAWAGEASKTASNPIFSKFTKVYNGKNSKGGLYLMHWLADVDNWYGFGSGTDFTFINTFQRGEQESCWETVPFPCIEEKKAGNKEQGIKGIFNRDAVVTPQWAYTNAPDAEDRAIQGVYDATKWGLEGIDDIQAKASEMGDELRNNMYDKYYQTIATNTSWTNGNAGDNSKHYLMNWYTSWGGALKSTGQDWCWQIGCSHAHEFYQNPLAAYALLNDLSSDMKAEGAKADYQKSLERQLEFYLWLQSSDGPIAGGATNSYHGRYETYPSGVPTFYGMMYVEHPVYADPGSNHWTGNQVWAVQRLAELYYWVKSGKGGDTTGVRPGGMSMEAALEQILDKWCAWFVNNTVLTSDGDFYMPSNLDWQGQPDSWNGTATNNSGLSCTISGYGNTDLGCVSSLANTLIYYAAAKGVKDSEISGLTETSVGGSFNYNIEGATNIKKGTKVYASSKDANLPKASLYLAQQLIDRAWTLGRDDIGMSRTEHNGSLARFFSQGVYIPENYHGEMPNGDKLEHGATFESIRSMYADASKCKGAKTSSEATQLVAKLREAYNKDVANGAKWSGDYSASSEEGKAELAKFKNVAAVDLSYHRFWHAGDDMMALGVMATLYPNLKPTGTTPTPKYPVAKATTSKNAFKLDWTAVDGADKYCVAYYTAGKWKILAQGNVLTYSRTGVPAGTYKVVVGARINGNWDTSNINKRAITLTIPG